MKFETLKFIKYQNNFRMRKIVQSILNEPIKN